MKHHRKSRIESLSFGVVVWDMVALVLVAIVCALVPMARAEVMGDAVGPTISPTGGLAYGNALAWPTVEPSSGVYRTSLDIDLPAARGLAQPRLSLQYSSAAGVGEAGMGWSLPLPVIERRNLSGPPRYDDSDRFAFMGRPLVPICRIGIGGVCRWAATSELMPEFTLTQDGWQYYRLQIDDLHARFFRSPDERRWIVQLPNGEAWELGALVGASNDGALDFDEVGTCLSATCNHLSNGGINRGVFRWNLARRVDTQGTSSIPRTQVVYVWQRLGTRGLGYLTDVYASPRAGFDPRISQPPEGDFAHHARFRWEPNRFLVNSFAHTNLATRDLRLAQVDVASRQFDGAGEREMLRRYHLEYEDRDHYAYLVRFQVEGRCAAPIREFQEQLPPTSCPRLPAVSFEYSRAVPTSPLLGNEVFANQPFVLGRGRKVLDYIVADVNSDSLPDLLETKFWFSGTGGPGTSGQNVYFNGPGLFTRSTIFGWDFPFSPLGYTVLGDFSGMGRTSIWYSYPWTYSPGVWIATAKGRWEWEKSGLPAGGPNYISLIGDIDGDGILDVFTDELGGPPSWSPDEAKFVLYMSSRESAFSRGALSCHGPSWRLRQSPALKWPDGSQARFLADMNGDGLADLVYVTQNSVHYWPGDGRGRFTACKGAACSCTQKGRDAPAVAMSAPFLGPDAHPAYTYLHDVNGDGLADLISVTKHGIRVYLNSSGRSLTEVETLEVPAHQLWPGLVQKVDADLETVRVFFADMNGDGISDIVFFVGDRVFYLNLFGSFGSWTAGLPRPGLLTRIHNGLGATTQVQYWSTADLAKIATNTKPWVEPLPQVQMVVKNVLITTLPSGGQAKTLSWTYDYDAPAYDGWERRFRGFRKMKVRQAGDAHAPGVTIDTEFYMGPCQSSGGCPPGGHDNDPLRTMASVPTVTEVSDANGVYHSTTSLSYTVVDVEQGTDGRWVRYAYPSRMDIQLYDLSRYQPGDGNGKPWTIQSAALVRDVLRELASGPVPIRSRANPQLLRVTQEMDRDGNVIEHVAHGRIKDDGSAVDDPIVRKLVMKPARRDWRALPATLTIDPFPARPGIPDSQSRTFRYEYDTAGNLTEVYGTLNGSLSLDRSHTDGGSFAPAHPNASTDREVRLALHSYDVFGNLVRTEGPNGQCATADYDPAYAELPVASSVFRAGCGNAPLTTRREFDRGLGTVTLLTGPTGATAVTKYDGFGRLSENFAPDPATGAAEAMPSRRIHYHITPGGPTQRIEIETRIAPGQFRSTWTYSDALGDPLLSLSQADPAAGDGGRWVASGLPLRTVNGTPFQIHQPWFTNVNPTATADIPAGLTPGAVALRVDYDAFGRPLRTFGPDGTQLSQRDYHALSVDVRDAEDLRIGPHLDTGATVERDGHGRVIRILRRIRQNNVLDVLTTSVAYQASGEPLMVVQGRSASPGRIVRWMQYDSLGRLVLNAEPNTSNAFAEDPAAASAMKAWRYAYDDSGRLVGTSDARGCGKNLHYDPVGRLVAEDYSPCHSRQAAYSPYDPQTGLGAEVLHRYDTPEPGQTSDFGLQQAFLAGKLVASQDRAAHTRYAYDGRGRVVGIARRISRPKGGYSLPWFRIATAYDDVDRAVRQTTGADVPQLLDAQGQSIVNLEYTLGGLLNGIGGSYGSLLVSAKRDADGAPTILQYGDIAGTQATLAYDSYRRILRRTLSRTAPANWSVVASPYGPVPAGTRQQVLADDVFTYDAVGNPTRIEDRRDGNEWPAGAQPVTRNVGYDDLYRLVSIDYSRPGGSDTQRDPFAPERNAGFGVPPAANLPDRVKSQSFSYDWLGNIVASGDDASAFFDRSLGPAVYGSAVNGPHRLLSASPSLAANYDGVGNLIDLVVQRAGPCLDAAGRCTLRFVYEWDEVGQLSRARRWDFKGAPRRLHPDLPATPPEVDLQFRYAAAGSRILKSAAVHGGRPRYTVDIFPSLRLERARFVDEDDSYERTAATEIVYLAGLGRVLSDKGLPSPGGNDQHVFLELADHLGSTSVVIDKESSELVQRTTYQTHGAVDSDYRPARWSEFREPYRFTGKEDDYEIGLIYFGARYYLPAIGRFISPDPMTMHVLGSDSNPYAYVRGRLLAVVDPDGLDGAACMGKEAICAGRGGGAGGDGTVVQIGAGDANPDHQPGSASQSGSVRMEPPPANSGTFASTVDSILMHTTPVYLWGRWIVAPRDTLDRMAHVVMMPMYLLGAPNTVSDASYIPARNAGSTGQAAMSDTDQLVSIAESEISAHLLGAGVRAAVGAAQSALFRVSVQEAGPMASPNTAWGARMQPEAIVSDKAPTLTMAQGYQIGNDLGTAGYTLALGKFPGNIQFVKANPWTYTIDRPWGWRANYNAGAIRGHMDAGGRIQLVPPRGIVDPLAPGIQTGVYRLEVQQILGNW